MAEAKWKELRFPRSPFDELSDFAKAAPAVLLKKPPEAWFGWIRCFVSATQARLARSSGLHPSVLSRLEGGSDALLSTWRQAYSALGFELVLLPVPRAPYDELRRLNGPDGPVHRRWRRRPRARRRRFHEALALGDETSGGGRDSGTKDEAPGA